MLEKYWRNVEIARQNTSKDLNLNQPSYLVSYQLYFIPTDSRVQYTFPSMYEVVSHLRDVPHKGRRYVNFDPKMVKNLEAMLNV